MAESRRPTPRADEDPGFVVIAITLLAKIIQWLMLSLVLAVFVEWVGMTWWWSEEGVGHSRRMLEVERRFLGTASQHHLLALEPARLGDDIGRRLSSVIFDLTRLNRVMEWAVETPSRDEPRLRATIHRFANRLADYLVAAKNRVLVFGVRMTVLLLAMPVLVLCCIVALIDGFVRRDLRRWGGGRESGFIYHWAKQVALPLAVGAWIIYLVLPVSIHPTLVIFTFAALLSMATTAAAGTFKKYL